MNLNLFSRFTIIFCSFFIVVFQFAGETVSNEPNPDQKFKSSEKLILSSESFGSTGKSDPGAGGFPELVRHSKKSSTILADSPYAQSDIFSLYADNEDTSKQASAKKDSSDSQTQNVKPNDTKANASKTILTVKENNSLTGTKKKDAPDSKVKPVKQDSAITTPAPGDTGGPKTSPNKEEQPSSKPAPSKPSGKSSSKSQAPPKSKVQSPQYLTEDQGHQGILPFAGYPDAEKAVEEMSRDIVRGMNTRNVTRLYQQWRRYCAQVLARTNALNTGNELNNRCRLTWYDQLYRDPLSTPRIMESYSRKMYSLLGGSAYAMIMGVRDSRNKLDVQSTENPIRVPVVHSAEEAVEMLKSTLERTAELQKQSVSPLTPEEKNLIARDSQTIFCSLIQNGHTLPNIPWAKYIIDLLEKMDKGALFDAAECMLSITDDAFLKQLSQLDPTRYEPFEHNGQKLHRIKTEAGYIVIGDKGGTVWDLDSMAGIACVLDLGGNDHYKEGICNIHRPVFLVLDLGNGDDRYDGSRIGIQGGAILGVTLWYNQGGNNRYVAKDVSQGSAIGGAGILIDESGNDTYKAFLRSQGSALCGMALLIDRAGSDDYHAALLSQGLGNPAGFAALVDKSGNDHYYVGGFFPDSYEEHPGYDGWGQGLGAGIRQVACGGIGLLLEGDGDDLYEYDYFAHGGGYWMGIGLIRDFNGNDKRPNATAKEYYGGPRQQGSWQRFSCGFGCHYALGYCFDDHGNDSYGGTIMGTGMGWDLAAGFLIDFDGDDIFTATQGLTQGVGAEGSIGVLMEYRGNNTYYGASQGYAGSKLTYHAQSDCGANFSFLVDHGGKDAYGINAQNNTMSQSGMATGFIIDRPTPQELAQLEKERQEALAKAKEAEKAQREKAQAAGVTETTVARPAQPAMAQPQYVPQYQNYQQNTGFFGRGLRGR